MLDALLDNTSAPPTVRRPQIRISFSAGGGGGGAGLLSAGLDLISGGGQQDPWQRSLVSLMLDASLAPFVDTTRLIVAGDEQAPVVANDDEGTIALGYEDSSMDTVMTARVNQLSFDTRNVTRITAVNGAAALSQLRINQGYEQQTAGDVVNDLCSQADVDTDVVESGIDLPFYVIDDRYNGYEHIDRLARKSGYVAYFTTEGKLYFGPAQTGQPIQTFNYADDILELKVQKNSTSDVSVSVIGEGAAGSEGQEAWNWLIKDPGAVTAQAGDGKTRLVQDSALRNNDACKTAAQGFADRTASLTLTGEVLVPGAPAVTVGSIIEISAAPNDDGNGQFFVTGVSHRYSKRRGFTSLIRVKQTSSANAGGLLGGLL